MAIDPAYGNSSGYFKDPVSGEDLSPDTPRVIKCELKDGKFIWPCVMQSDGEQILKIVYKYFTEEEKDLYKQYRGRPSGTTRSRSPSSKPKTIKQEEKHDEPVHVMKHSEESAASLQTLMTLAECDRLYGVSQIAGITYALVGKHNSNVVHHIPRSVIPDDEFERLNNEGEL